MTTKRWANLLAWPLILPFALLVLASCLLTPCLALASTGLQQQVQQVGKLDKAGIYIDDENQVQQQNAATALAPASTLKLLTAYLALKRWGPEHRFETRFYRSGHCLWVKGLGDPYLTSEEIEAISTAIKSSTDRNQFHCIGVDSSLFPDLTLDGRGQSDNPYDAGNSAFGVNFNSMLLKRETGRLVSAEPQTPLTPIVSLIVSDSGLQVGSKPKRVSLPGGQRQSAQYAAEVLSLLLFDTVLPISHGDLPKKRQLIYTHRNSKPLSEVVQLMLKYSNNYIANQLFLLMAPLTCSSQVSSTLAKQYYQRQVSKLFGWQNVVFEDGAGLSRANRVSVLQLVELLESMRDWRYLLSSYHHGRIFAKTGTMSNISSVAGYYLADDKQWRVFAFVANDFRDHRFRSDLLKQLSK